MQNDSAIPFRKVRDFGDVLNVTFSFIRQNFALLIKSLLFLAAPVGALAMLFSSLMQARLLAFDLESLTDPMALFGLEYVAALFFGLLSVVVAIDVVFSFMVLYEERGPGGFDFTDVRRMSLQRFLGTLGTVLFLFLLVMLPVPLILIPCLGALAYLVGAVYFGIVFSLVLPMRIRERVGLVEGLQRCTQLVRGYWWPTAGVLFIAWITYSILGTLFNTPTMIMLFVSGFHGFGEGGGGPVGLLFTLLSMVGGLGTTLLYSIPLVATGFQYFSLVERKERTGLMARIDQVAEGGREGREEKGEGGF